MCVGVLRSFWWVTILTVGLKIKFFCSLLIQYFENFKLYYSFIYDDWEVTKNRYFEQMINDRL